MRTDPTLSTITLTNLNSIQRLIKNDPITRSLFETSSADVEEIRSKLGELKRGSPNVSAQGGKPSTPAFVQKVESVRTRHAILEPTFAAKSRSQNSYDEAKVEQNLVASPVTSSTSLARSSRQVLAAKTTFSSNLDDKPAYIKKLESISHRQKLLTPAKLRSSNSPNDCFNRLYSKSTAFLAQAYNSSPSDQVEPARPQPAQRTGLNQPVKQKDEANDFHSSKLNSSTPKSGNSSASDALEPDAAQKEPSNLMLPEETHVKPREDELARSDSIETITNVRNPEPSTMFQKEEAKQESHVNSEDFKKTTLVMQADLVTGRVLRTTSRQEQPEHALDASRLSSNLSSSKPVFRKEEIKHELHVIPTDDFRKTTLKLKPDLATGRELAAKSDSVSSEPQPSAQIMERLADELDKQSLESKADHKSEEESTSEYHEKTQDFLNRFFNRELLDFKLQSAKAQNRVINEEENGSLDVEPDDTTPRVSSLPQHVENFLDGLFTTFDRKKEPEEVVRPKARQRSTRTLPKTESLISATNSDASSNLPRYQQQPDPNPEFKANEEEISTPKEASTDNTVERAPTSLPRQIDQDGTSPRTKEVISIKPLTPKTIIKKPAYLMDANGQTAEVVSARHRKNVTFFEDPKYGMIPVEIPEWQETLREPTSIKKRRQMVK